MLMLRRARSSRRYVRRCERRSVERREAGERSSRLREADAGAVESPRPFPAVVRPRSRTRTRSRSSRSGPDYGATLTCRGRGRRGWAPNARQVGQSGKTVKRGPTSPGHLRCRPHLAVMQTADTIIAVNPSELRLPGRDYGVGSDLFAVADALSDQFGGIPGRRRSFAAERPGRSSGLRAGAEGVVLLAGFWFWCSRMGSHARSRNTGAPTAAAGPRLPSCRAGSARRFGSC